ncbi:hypothetical protein SprV_0702286700 [Sparganum proliferum]
MLPYVTNFKEPVSDPRNFDRKRIINDCIDDLGCSAIMFADDVKLWRAIRSDADRQLRGDIIQTYRIVGGRECALDFDEFFELAGTDRLRGHPFKLQWKLASSDVRRNAFSHRVIGAWNGLPEAVVFSETVESFKSKLLTLSDWNTHLVLVICELEGLSANTSALNVNDFYKRDQLE